MSTHPRPNMVDTKDGPVDLGMLVGALIRSRNVGTVGRRLDRYETHVLAERKPRSRCWPEPAIREGKAGHLILGGRRGTKTPNSWVYRFILSVPK